MKFDILSEYCFVNMGQSPASETYNNNADGLPFYQGNADFGEIHPQTRIWCSAPVKIANKGDLLISVRAPIGALNIATEQCCIGRGLAVLTPKLDKCRIKYIYFAIQSQINFLIANGTGSTFKAVNKNTLENLLIPVSSLNKQDEIVNIFEKLNNIINKRKEQLLLLDNAVKSRFIEMFGDPLLNPYNLITVKLGTVLAVEPQNGLYKPQSDYVVDKSGIPILRIDSFYNGQLRNLNSLKRLNCSDIEKKRYLLKENDIVINRVNSIEYLGKCALITGLIEDTLFESNMMRLHVDETKYNPVYVTYLLCSKFIYNQILSMAKKAVNQASINQKDVENFEIYMPNLNSQNEFADFVKQTDKSKLEIQKSLDKLEILKKSLMQQYFG